MYSTDNLCHCCGATKSAGPHNYAELYKMRFIDVFDAMMCSVWILQEIVFNLKQNLTIYTQLLCVVL